MRPPAPPLLEGEVAMPRSFARIALAVLLATLLPLAGPAAPLALAAPGDHAISLNGTSQNVRLAYGGDANFTGSITIEAWVKRSSETRCETIVGNGYLDSYWFGICGSEPGEPARLRFYRGEGASADGSAAIPAGVWTHVAVSYDGATRRFYVNGRLDAATTASSGPLRAAPNGSGRPLGVGADPASGPDPWAYRFQGLLDEVRIWRTVRTQEEIAGAMFQPVAASAPGLALAFAFNGDVQTIRAFDDGSWVGAPAYSPDGAIPRDIRVPPVIDAPTLDGACDTGGEYAGATEVTAHGAEAWLLHTPTDLWVCFPEIISGAAVYLDADLGRGSAAGSDDLVFEVFPASERARAGDGLGGYVEATLPAGSWDGAFRRRVAGPDSQGTEFRIGKSLIGAGQVIGLALATYATPVGQPRLWPALAAPQSPASWSAVTLGGTAPAQTYAGNVFYTTRDRLGANLPVPGVGVRLVGFEPSGGEAVVGFARSDHSGTFSITSSDDYTRHRLDLDVSTLPRGYTTRTASLAASTAYSNNFSLQDAQPTAIDPLNGPYFLIVAPRAIVASGVLRNFVAYKQQLGFQVEVVTVETIDATVSGANRRDRVRNLELARYATYGPRFQYVMLIGPHSVIPMTIFDTLDEEGDCLTQGLPSDWYYVDLTSPMDSNGNGCIADGIWTDPARRRISTPGDAGIRFEPTVALGRLPFTTPAAVEMALRTSMRFEQQASEMKLRALAGMAMMDLRARCWSPADDAGGAYEECNTTGTDGAYLATALDRGILSPGGYAMTPFYENFAPPTGSSPAYLTSPEPLTGRNVIDELDERDYGLVNLHGHGGPDGVVRTAWTRDGNENGTVETPAQPAGDPPRSQNEVGQPPLLDRRSMEEVSPDFYAGAPVYIVAACSTSDFLDPASFGATILSQGKGAAFVGALTTAQYTRGWTAFGGGGMSDVDYLVTRNLLGRHMRLGDAVWHGLSEYIRRGNTDFSTVVFDLYGDPTLSYWGNGGGQSTMAAWPMLRQNAFGGGSSTLVGPGAPQRLWTYEATAPAPSAMPPSPLVSNNGEVIVAHGAFVDVVKRGRQAQRLTLDAAAYGTPALAADGTLYALDVNGRLYAFAYGDPGFRDFRSRRWALDLGSAPSTSPVIGSDGFVAVGRAGGTLFGGTVSLLTLVRPDGVRWREELVAGALPGSLAIHADRALYITTDRGQVARIEPFCAGSACRRYDNAGSGGAYSTPPLLANGALYAGRAGGLLVKKHTTTLADLATFAADGAITSGPVAGPDGQVVFGTAAGTLYSLTPNLELRWSRSLGASVQGVPAFSADALYLVSGDRLRAFNPASGAPLWDRSLGAGAGTGSTAVGYGRELYVQTAGGGVLAFGEGWVEPPSLVLATPLAILPQQSLAGVRVEWRLAPALTSSAAPQDAGASGFLVQRSSGDGAWLDVATLPRDARGYTDTGVAPGVSYRYRVKTLDAAGRDSDFTTAAEEIRSLPALPGAPLLGPVEVLASDRLRLTWTQGDDEVTGYRVERSLAPGGPFAAVGVTTGEAREYVDAELAPGTAYHYRVRPLNSLGEGGSSNVASGTTRQRSLPAPERVVAALLPDGRVRVSWSGAPAGATAVIEVNPQGYAGYLPLGTAGGAGPFVYDHGMPSSFGYRVKFVQGDAESTYAEAALRVNTSGFVGQQRLTVSLPIVGR
jgi:hypothetical protein